MLVDRLSSKQGCWGVGLSLAGSVCEERKGPSFPFSVSRDPSRWAPALHLTLHSQPGLKCGSSGETQGTAELWASSLGVVSCLWNNGLRALGWAHGGAGTW